MYQTKGSAGMDLSACIDEDILIKKGETVLCPTGIAIALPDNFYEIRLVLNTYLYYNKYSY